MQGNFQGWGEFIDAGIYETPRQWFLGGGSFQQGVAASARCFKKSADDGGAAYFSWHQDNGQRTDMGTGWAMCALIRVSGRFHSTSEYVKVVLESGNHWYLDGSSTTQDVMGYAACYNNVISGPEYTWTSGRKNLEDTGVFGKKFCYMTKIGGNFDNAADQAGIFLDTSVNPELWYIVGASSGGKELRARCASFN